LKRGNGVEVAFEGCVLEKVGQGFEDGGHCAFDLIAVGQWALIDLLGGEAAAVESDVFEGAKSPGGK
jgi:hypothetical protein